MTQPLAGRVATAKGALWAATLAAFWRVDIVVNNAGFVRGRGTVLSPHEAELVAWLVSDEAACAPATG